MSKLSEYYANYFMTLFLLKFVRKIVIKLIKILVSAWKEISVNEKWMHSEIDIYSRYYTINLFVIISVFELFDVCARELSLVRVNAPISYQGKFNLQASWFLGLARYHPDTGAFQP